MNNDKRWILLLALTTGMALGAAFASRARRRHVQTAQNLQHKEEVKAWENEGGNLAPAASTAVQPAIQP